MKQFFKFMFASMLGTILTFGLIFVVFLIMIAAVVALTEKDTTAPPAKSVLMLNLEDEIVERGQDNPFSNLKFGGFNYAAPVGLNDILSCIKKAETDANISGIYIESPTVGSGPASTEEIRNALLAFKKTGKFIISYGDMYSQKGYYLATAADKIYINPQGYFELKGISADVMFIKGLLDKLDIEAQIIRHGKYKSAIEPLIQDKMSPANKEQMQTMISSIWNHLVKGISETRKLSAVDINTLANGLKVTKADQALNYKLVDSLVYKDGVYAVLHKLLKTKADEKINFITLSTYKDSPSTVKTESGKDKIAVIYASGDIVVGNEEENNIPSEVFAKAVRKAREDKNVKAIVLRINSPGGVMIAADIILRELKLAAKEKPIVSSFGDYAASGGYYIACASNYIIAQPTTITGSIGVFSIIPNLQKTLKNKLGITVDGVKTNDNAEYVSLLKPMTAFQKEVMLRETESAYGTFIGYVAQNRKMTVANVDSIGQGRVWTGADALKIGLVDEIGSINRAIEKAAELAKIKNYRLMTLPKMKDPMTQIMESISGKSKEEVFLKSHLGELYEYYSYIKFSQGYKGIQARLPWIIDLN